MEDMFRVGVIANTHGIRGEVKVYPTTGDVTRYKKLKEVLLDTGKEYDIEQYKGHDLYVTRENAIPLEEGEYYLADIIDAKVVTEEGEDFGILKDVLETGANLVYVVEHEGKEVLLPVIPECVKNVDVSAGIVTVHIMKGLV